MQRSRLLTMLLILTVLSSIALRTFPASAQPNYSPGVKPGDSITYGEFSINGTTPYPPFPANISSIKIQIQSVNTQTSTVNASLVYSYKNGTQSTQSLSGNTVTGQGNLFPYLVAGNLTAGDLLFNSPYPYYPYVFNATVERVYGGALRSVNLFNITLTNPGQFVQAQFYWDVQTGFLLDAAEHVNYPGQSFSIHFKATDTNVWTPNTSPDYSLDASALSSDVIHRGESTSFRLDLTSLNGFSGNVGFALGVFAPNNMQPPGAMVTPTDVPLSAGNSANALVTVSFNSTTSLGQYVILVNGTSGPINHQARLLVAAAPPDFIVEANPPNMTIFQGTSKTSIIIVTGRGGFTGTVFLELITQPPFGTFVTSTLSQTSVTINSTVTSGTSILTVSALNSQPGLTSVGLNAYSGILYRTLYIPVNVTGPDFRITATPASLTMRQGDTGESIITLTSVLGFSGLVNLSASLYGNISGSLSNTAMNVPADGQANSTLTITSFPSSPPGFASAYVTGSSFTGLSHSVYIQINVTGPDFRFQAGNYFFNLDPGQSANSTLTLFSVEGFSGTISLSISTYGPIQAAVTPVEITLNSTQTAATAVLMVTALPASPSTYAQVDVRASSGNLVHDVYISLTVTGPDFSIMTNPYLLSIPQGGSGQATVSLSSIDNFSGNVTLSTSSSLPATISSNPVTLSPGGTTITTLTIQVPLNTSPGNYFIQITATSASLFHYSSIEVYVIGPDFLLTASPSYLTIPQGGNTTSTVSVTSLDNLEGTVSISVYTIGPITVSPFNATLTLSRNSTATMSLQISASPGLTPGIYDAIITASLGSVLHSTGITVQVVGPDFSFYALPSSLALKPGQTGTSTLHLNSLMGFGGNVTLSVFSNGLNATLSDTTLALPSGGSASTDVTIQAPSDASPSNYYYVTVQASSGTITHTLSIFVQIIAPDFTIIPNPFQLTIQAGTSAQSTLQLTSINGFNGTVSLTSFPSVFGNFTSPIAATLSASNVTLTSGGSASVVLNITATAEAAGENFYIQVEATSGSLIHFTSVYVTVTGPSFQLSANPSFLTLPQGGSSGVTITASSIEGFSGNVTLSLGLPFGIIASINPVNVSVISGGAAVSTLNVTALSVAQPGYYGVAVTGTSGTMSRTVFVQVRVTGASFSLTASPIFMILNPGSSGNSTITLTGSGFSGTISLSAFSFPSGLTTNLNPTSLTLNSTLTSATSELTITAPADVAPGLYLVGISANSNGIIENTTIYVKVPGGDFTFFANPSSLTLHQGGSASTTINVSALQNFSGLVNFTAYAFGPGFGLQESFTPLNVTLSPANPNATLTMTVSALPETATGPYTVIVNAFSFAGGNFTFHSITVNATVLAGPDFTMSVSPIFMNIVQGTTGYFTFSLVGQNSFSGNVTLTAVLTPPGPTASFSDSTVFLGQGSNAISTLAVAGDSSVGFYNVTFTATSGNLSHQLVVNIYIAPKPDFNLATSSAGLIIVSGASATSAVSVSPINGFVAPVTLSATGPAGFTTSYSTNPIPGGSGGSALTVTVASSVATGSYIVTVTGTSGPLTHTATINVTVSSSTKTNLVVSQVSWNHRLSLSKNGNTQTFTLILKNTSKSILYVQLLAAGNSTDLKSFFNLKSGVALLVPGSSLTISLSQAFNTASIGSKYSFTLQLFYGTSIDSSGNILNPQTLQVVKGAFTIVS